MGKPNFKELLVLLRAEKNVVTLRLRHFEKEELLAAPRHLHGKIRAKYEEEKASLWRWIHEEEAYLNACIKHEEEGTRESLPIRIARPSPRCIYKPERFDVSIESGKVITIEDLPEEVERIMLLVHAIANQRAEKELLDMTITQIQLAVMELWKRINDDCEDRGNRNLDAFLSNSFKRKAAP